MITQLLYKILLEMLIVGLAIYQFVLHFFQGMENVGLLAAFLSF